MSNPPLILTAHVNDQDLLFFDNLRAQFFPADRNFLRAHVTMFHKLPSEHLPQIEDILEAEAARMTRAIEVGVIGVRNMGNGVAFVLDSEHLMATRARLKTEFTPWLAPQDHQPWGPHITVQNKVHWQKAEALYDTLSREFARSTISVEGLDLWSYLGGPWRHERFFSAGGRQASQGESLDDGAGRGISGD